jgi:hypothetical protein
MVGATVWVQGVPLTDRAPRRAEFQYTISAHKYKIPLRKARRFKKHRGSIIIDQVGSIN